MISPGGWADTPCGPETRVIKRSDGPESSGLYLILAPREQRPQPLDFIALSRGKPNLPAKKLDFAKLGGNPADSEKHNSARQGV